MDEEEPVDDEDQEAARGRGRPSIGRRRAMHVPDDVWADVERAAKAAGVKAAEEARRRLAAPMATGETS